MVVTATEEILASPVYREAHTALVHELLREGTVSGERILQIVNDAAGTARGTGRS